MSLSSWNFINCSKFNFSNSDLIVGSVGLNSYLSIIALTYNPEPPTANISSLKDFSGISWSIR